MLRKQQKRALLRELKPSGLSLPVRAKLARLAVQAGGSEAHLGHLVHQLDGVEELGVKLHVRYEQCLCGACDPQVVLVGLSGPRASVLV